MSDQIVRVITSDGAVMASAITGKELVEHARQIHKTLPVATAALGRSLMGASMMGNQLKGDNDSLTLQIRGGGPLGMITCVSDSQGNVRGYVTNPFVDIPRKSQGKLDVGAAVGTDGSLTVIKDLGLKEPYVGSIPLVTGEIAEDITAYFATRDQSVSAAGGYLIQLLPGADDAVIDKVERGIQQVGYVTHAFQEGVTPLELVQKVLGEFEVEVLETTPVEYRCYCSRERVSRALISLGVDELQKMIDEQGQAQLSCHFCNKEYTFDKAELEALIQSIRQG